MDNNFDISKVSPKGNLMFYYDGEEYGSVEAIDCYNTINKSNPYVVDKYVLAYFMATFKLSKEYVRDNFREVHNKLNECLTRWCYSKDYPMEYELEVWSMIYPVDFKMSDSFVIDTAIKELLISDLSYIVEKTDFVLSATSLFEKPNLTIQEAISILKDRGDYKPVILKEFSKDVFTTM